MVNPLESSSSIIRIHNDDINIRKPVDLSTKQVSSYGLIEDKTDSLMSDSKGVFSQEPIPLDSYSLTKAFKNLFSLLNFEGKTIYGSLENLKNELQVQHKAIIKFCDPRFDILREVFHKYREDQSMHELIGQILTNSSQEESEITQFIMLLSQLLVSKKDKELSKELNNYLNFKDDSKTVKNESGLEKILSLIEENIEEFLDEIKRENLEEALKSLSISQNLKEPMLHFFLPIQYEERLSHGEVWIDVEEDEGESGSKRTHLFLTLEVDEVGIYEVDIYEIDRSLDIKISAQGELKDKINTSELIEIIRGTGIIVNSLRLEELRERNKIEKVFSKDMFIRRNIDAKA